MESSVQYFVQGSIRRIKISPDMTAAWKETSLPTILSRYELKGIYNADEFDLFHQGLLKKTLHLKGERCSGEKYSEVRLMERADCTCECHWREVTNVCNW